MVAWRIVENMIVAVIFSPNSFLVICLVGALSVYVGLKGKYIWGLIMLALTAGIMWPVGLELSAQCTSCTYVDRIYHSAVRWGLSFWLVLFGIGLSIVKLRQGYRKKI